MSNLSIFKIGIGPSSSHTVGPFSAGGAFIQNLDIDNVNKIKVTLFGSLSLTGKGHLSDIAVLLGLSGLCVKTISKEEKNEVLNKMNNKKLLLAGKKEIDFVYEEDIIFSKEFKKLHENALSIVAYDKNNKVLKEQTYYSVGGGFIKEEEQMLNENTNSSADNESKAYEFSSATELLWLCNKYNQNIAQIALNYELNFHTEEYVNNYCKEIYLAMKDSYLSGRDSNELILPGPIKLKRRAPALAKKLQALHEKGMNRKDDLDFIDYFSLYAMSVAEENAAGNRVVTAPTNGACAVVPAVLFYIKNHVKDLKDKEIRDFLLVAMAIGSLFKKNASISGAEAGCQAEIGSASSMAAAAFAFSMGAVPIDCCSAAEIAMEHHLGLTCDPVAGLVQIPCIERNVFGAIKAVSAAKMAMDRDSAPSVGLDEVIKTMYETGKDMDTRYKETSLAGLATNYKSLC
ncbi:L-serine ammonia-lyase [Campylobacter canadensis]|uniref:L-serine dehydratase n=1 Tax=Campylobacter canadensis TaxID=449520 RepID=A0ABS7WQU7_9BACT|nr:L-serine ammonia-lyase [Campylobacter canadensis]MBZ7987131.1 L-serine ammonia-lyase [Campylobacter canadensis]MBZ7994515.1 L-serine ammonia-lyase [Campylobacter canadensis]MBZ7997202.1 L-serine ammonia-lyase [Campylobacter canadensis]MBZ7998245.1 L-serine ammonia-lyase [Campylobacter canadensis]MBZ7999770.1 L-serine ammonia-lyase [Campylobacter canadensis]